MQYHTLTLTDDDDTFPQQKLLENRRIFSREDEQTFCMIELPVQKYYLLLIFPHSFPLLPEDVAEAEISS